VAAAVLSDDGTRLTTGGADGLLRLWEVETGKLVSTQAMPGYRAVPVGFLPGKGGILAAGTDRLWVWDVAGGALTRSVTGADEHVVLSRDGRLAVTGFLRGVSILDLATGATLCRILSVGTGWLVADESRARWDGRDTGLDALTWVEGSESRPATGAAEGHRTPGLLAEVMRPWSGGR
jgi:hypothetical protein